MVCKFVFKFDGHVVAEGNSTMTMAYDFQRCFMENMEVTERIGGTYITLSEIMALGVHGTAGWTATRMDGKVLSFLVTKELSHEV